MPENLKQEAATLVSREGWLLDCRRWDEWLSLYRVDAEYWLPCYKSEHELTVDPECEISLIYYSSRAGLEDRVFRIRTDRSLASTPLPRTSHLVTMAECLEEADGSIRVESNWVTHSYKLEQTTYFFGTQTHILTSGHNGLLIKSRKIIVMNDIIPSLLDIYSV